MKLRTLCGCLLTVAFMSCAAREPYPVSNVKYFTNGEFDTTYVQQLIAVEGRIINIAPGPVGKPLLEVALSHPVNRNIWIAGLIANDHALLKVGHSVRVLGYLYSADASDIEIASVTTDKHFVLGYCIADFTNGKSLYLPDGIEDCRKWESGASAEELRDAP